MSATVATAVGQSRDLRSRLVNFHASAHVSGLSRTTSRVSDLLAMDRLWQVVFLRGFDRVEASRLGRRHLRLLD